MLKIFSWEDSLVQNYKTAILSVINICASKKFILFNCHSGLDPESSLWISVLEFLDSRWSLSRTCTWYGAGMTPHAQFIMSLCIIKQSDSDPECGIRWFRRDGKAEETKSSAARANVAGCAVCARRIGPWSIGSHWEWFLHKPSHWRPRWSILSLSWVQGIGASDGSRTLWGFRLENEAGHYGVPRFEEPYRAELPLCSL